MNNHSPITQKAIQTILDKTNGLGIISLKDLAMIRNREVRLKALIMLRYTEHYNKAGQLIGYKSTKPNRKEILLGFKQ